MSNLPPTDSSVSADTGRDPTSPQDARHRAIDYVGVEDASAIIGAAREEIRKLCHGKQWRMCIPVEPSDSDIVFSRLLRLALLLDQSRVELDGLRADAERMRAYLNDCPRCRNSLALDASERATMEHINRTKARAARTPDSGVKE